MRHIWRFPDDLEFTPVVHKATNQRYHILEFDCSVETPHGTMVGRKGDYLLVGVNGQLYVLGPDAFREAYDNV